MTNGKNLLSLINERKINAIIHRHIPKTSIVKLVDTANINTVDIGGRPSLVMRHDPTFWAKMMSSNLSVPLVTYQIFDAFFNLHFITWTSQHNCPSPLAKAAITTPNSGQIKTAGHWKFNFAAMAWTIKSGVIHVPHYHQYSYILSRVYPQNLI